MLWVLQNPFYPVQIILHHSGFVQLFILWNDITHITNINLGIYNYFGMISHTTTNAHLGESNIIWKVQYYLCSLPGLIIFSCFPPRYAAHLQFTHICNGDDQWCKLTSINFDLVAKSNGSTAHPLLENCIKLLHTNLTNKLKMWRPP